MSRSVAGEEMAGRISSPVLVGRGEEMRTFEALLDTAAAGTGRTVLVAGEAGVGKSRLVREVASLAAARGAHVLVGASVDFGEGSLPFGAVTEALRPVGRLVGAETVERVVGASRIEVARVLPDLQPADAPPATGRPDEYAQSRLFELLLRLLAALTERAPVLLVLEDLHWADASTREFLGFLARNVAGTRLLAVGTYRSDELHRTHPLRPYVATLVASRAVDAIELARLDTSGVRQLVSAILEREPEPGLVEALHGRALGNPFFTEELLSAGRGRLPTNLRDVLLSRAEQVGEPARRVLRALAVLARPADEALLGTMTELGDAELTDALRDAAGRHVIVRGDGDDARWSFRHALLQEAIYDDLLAGERRALHRAAGDALAARAGDGRGGNVQAELALHFRRGGDAERAIAAAARAARTAADRYAYGDALRDWEQVLELWHEVDAPDAAAGLDHVAVLAEAAQAAGAAGDHRRATSLTRAAIAEVDAEREPLRAAVGHAFLMSELFSLGEAAEADAARRAALELSARMPPSLEHARVLNMVAYPLLFASRYAEVEAIARRALAIAEEHGASDEAAVAALPLGIAATFLGRVDEGRAAIERALRSAQEARHPHRLADSYLALGIVLEAAGDFEQAVSAMSSGLDALRALGVERTLGTTTLRANLGEALRRMGRWQESLDTIETALGGESIGWELAHASALKGHLLAAIGRHDESQRALETAWQHFGRAGTGFVGHYFAARAENELWRDRPDDALDVVRAGLAEIRHTRDLRWIGELTALGARAAADLGPRLGRSRPGEAGAGHELLGELMQARDEAFAEGTVFASEVTGYIATARAECARNDRPGSVEPWTQAVTAWERLGQPYPRAYAAFREAEAVLVAGGSRGRAAERLGSAGSTARALGGAPLLAAIDALARRARLTIPAHAEGDPGARDAASRAAGGAPLGLTAREREVLALLGEGRSDQEIADALFISAKTASVHVSNIKAKLGVDRRVEAALLASRIVGERGG